MYRVHLASARDGTESHDRRLPKPCLRRAQAILRFEYRNFDPSPLERAASSLARQQILLRYTNMPKAVRDAIAEVSEQEGGTRR